MVQTLIRELLWVKRIQNIGIVIPVDTGTNEVDPKTPARAIARECPILNNPEGAISTAQPNPVVKRLLAPIRRTID